MQLSADLHQLSASGKACQILCFWIRDQQVDQEVNTGANGNRRHKGNKVSPRYAPYKGIYAPVDQKSSGSHRQGSQEGHKISFLHMDK